MPRPRTRPFSLLDGMILIAGIAVGLAIGKLAYESFEVQDSTDFKSWFVDPFGMSLYGPTVALVLIRLRKPRPSLRKLIRQPGFAACVTVLVATAFYFGLRLLDQYLSQADHSIVIEVSFLNVYGDLIVQQKSVFAIVIAWSSLLITRLWRPEASWIDRTGRLLAVVWLLLLLTNAYAFGCWFAGNFLPRN